MSVAHKDIAIGFLREAASGNVHEAYQQHIAPGFKHHNPFFRGDADSLMKAMEEAAAKNPKKVIDDQRALEDGDFIAVHSRVRHNLGDFGAVVVHIFRFQGDRIIELWDTSQPVPEDSPNENGMF